MAPSTPSGPLDFSMQPTPGGPLDPVASTAADVPPGPPPPPEELYPRQSATKDQLTEGLKSIEDEVVLQDGYQEFYRGEALSHIRDAQECLKIAERKFEKK